jgi:CubicO group peptidase (beta-lactamase class C family)
MYKKELLRVSPESVGLSSGRLLMLLQALERSGTEMHGFMIERFGKIAGQCWWSPYCPDLVHICHSFGKSYVATAIGVACTEGLLSVDDKIVDLFKDEIAEYGIPLSDNLKKLTVEHVLTMSNGMSVPPKSGERLIENYLSCAVDKAPGSVFMYNTTGSCMLGAIVQKVTGMGVKDYLAPRVFEKIGLETDKLGWLKFKNGIDAAPGVSSTTENNLRLGLLYLNGGVWEGERIIDAEWIRKATSKRIDTDWLGGNIDGRSGYGYQLWMCRDAGTFRFDGGHGQISVMSPRLGMVVSINQAASMPSDSDASLDILHEHLLSASLPDSLPEDPAGLEALRAYEASRSLPPPKASPVPPDAVSWNGIYRVVDGRFHIQPELKPNDIDNVYEDFYASGDVYTKTLSFRFKDDASCELVLDGDIVLDVRLDGKIQARYTRCAMPTYYLTYSWGYFEPDGSFSVTTRYFQTCFVTQMHFSRTSVGLAIHVTKNTLHDAKPYFSYDASASRVVSP